MRESEQEQRRLTMTTAPVSPLVGKLAVPAVLSMLITSAYNMADALFVGRISTEATAAVGIVFSYMSLVQAVGFFLGQGSSIYMSRALGARNVEGAKTMAAAGFFTGLLIGLGMMVTGLAFMRPILRFLGTTPAILEDTRDYFAYVLLATPFMISAYVMNNQMRQQGNAALGTIGMATGAIMNIVLDPFLIFGAGMGVAGASLSTCVSQAASFVVLLLMTRRKDTVDIQWRHFRPTRAIYAEMARGGVPSLGRQGLASVATMILNNCAGAYGEAAIAAFAVVNRIVMLGSSCLIGIGHGFQPVCGFNYGAGLYGRVKEAYRFALRVTTFWAVIFAVVAWIFAPEIVALFRPDDVVVADIGGQALRFQAVVFPGLGLITMASMLLQQTGMTVPATLMAAARQGVFLIPAVLLGTYFGGLTGLELAQPVSDVLSLVLAAVLAKRGLARLGEGPTTAPSVAARVSGPDPDGGHDRRHAA